MPLLYCAYNFICCMYSCKSVSYKEMNSLVENEKSGGIKQMNKKLKVFISIAALLIIGALTYRGEFVRDVLVSAALFALALGVIEFIDRALRKRSK